MKLVRHPLQPGSPGARHELVSLHYGTPGTGPKAVIQASLHADEIPGMLVAHHLRSLLGTLEAAGRLVGEVVLLPAANPIGLGQWALHGFQGRFDVTSGENFNRHYLDPHRLADAVLQAVGGALDDDATANVERVRCALRQVVTTMPATTPLASLRRTLMGLAIDADIVLDLHSDGQAMLHFYTATALWPQARTLARCLGAGLVLLADVSGGDPFDEACSMVWPLLAARRPDVPLPLSCFAATIELRGESDVSHAYAQRDAEGLLRFLAERGLIDGPREALPALACDALPLAGSMPMHAPHAGIVSFLCEPGAQVLQGTPIADLIDPVEGTVTRIGSPVDGLFFARDLRRYAAPGMSLGKVAGRMPVREGKLLSV